MGGYALKAQETPTATVEQRLDIVSAERDGPRVRLKAERPGPTMRDMTGLEVEMIVDEMAAKPFLDAMARGRSVTCTITLEDDE